MTDPGKAWVATLHARDGFSYRLAVLLAVRKRPEKQAGCGSWGFATRPSSYSFAGIGTTPPFLRLVTGHRDFAEGRVSTRLVEKLIAGMPAQNPPEPGKAEGVRLS